MDMGLDGKRALVTGSSSGIGTGIARALAAEGVAVVVHGRNAERTRAVASRIAEAGGMSAAAVGSLSSDDSAAAVAAAALGAFGGIDILVNNAGGSAEIADGSWFAAQTSDWLETYQANVLAAVRMVHHLVPRMKEEGWGRVINIGTGAAITPTSGQPDYGPAKSAMLNMSLGLSKALRHTGITCNAVSPGMIRTEGLQRFLANFSAKRGWGDDLHKAEGYIVERSGQTVAKVGEVEDIAFAVTMLASPRADFINGINLHADGGISPSLH
jgi:3-oxoacyl-[acyl-carrier protein] reductase